MGKFNLLTTLSLNAAGMSDGLKQAVSEVENFVETSKKEGNSLNANFRDVAEMGIGEMRKELMKLKNVSFAGKTKEEITAINGRIGELMDSMGDLKAVQKSMGVELGSALAGGLQTLSAMGEMGVGVATMFGASKESAEKYQQAMVTLIGVTQAAGVIEDALATRQLQNLAVRLRATVVTAAQTVATQAATVAQWAYNASLLVVIGTIGAAVVVVAALVAGIYYLVAGHNEAADAAENQRMEEDLLNKKIEEGKIANNQMLALARAKGASAMELKQLEIGATYSTLQAMADKYNKEVAWIAKGNELKGEALKEHEKEGKAIIELDNQLEVLKVELVTLGKTSTDTSAKMVKGTKEVKDAYKEQLSEYQKLVDASTTEITQGDMNGDKGVSQLAPKGISKLGNSEALKERGQTKFGDAIKKTNSELKIQMGAMQSMNELMGGFGQAASTAFGEQSAAAKAFAVAQVITSAAMGIMGTWAGYAKFGPWGTALAVAQTAMIGGVAITQLGQIAGAFANGGIVGGQSYSGDNVSARVNSGEMILNNSQQAALFAMANGGGGSQNIQIYGRIKAGDIYLSNKRGEYTTNRRG